MTQFSSGKHTNLTADAMPYVWPSGTRSIFSYGGRIEVGYRPRTPPPEYAIVQRTLTNPANPFLANVRALLVGSGDPKGLREGFLLGLSSILDSDADITRTRAQLIHARAVLSRVACLESETHVSEEADR